MDQAKTYKWIQDRLRELHSGTLSEQDRAHLWAMAEEDPFVADALEGYQKHPDPSHTEHLDVLARKIILQKRERRRWLIPNLAVTAIAASLIIIVGTWAVINRMDNKDETLFVFAAPDSLGMSDTVASDIAINEEAPTEAITSSPTRDPSGSVAHQPLKAKDETYNREKQKAGDIKSFESDASKKESSQNEIAEPSLTETSESEEKMADDQPVTAPATGREDPSTFEDISFSAVKSTEKAKLDEGYYANQMDPDLMARRATGRVVDETGQPLIGANVVVHNTNLGTVTDLNGRFELYLPLPESEVEVTLTGYSLSTTVLRQGEDEAEIILTSGLAMSEITVVRKDSRSKSEKSMASGADLAAVSMVDSTTFIEYLKTNSKFPLRENFYSPGKDVKVEFTVSSNGKPEKVKILSSSGNKSMDEEAIRLIRKGPDWTCDGDVYPCVRNYTFYFQ